MRYKQFLKECAIYLRKHMTKEERKLWYKFFTKISSRVYRQKVIYKFIVDFYYHPTKLVIEIDGSQHYSIDGKISDIERDITLNNMGYTVLRYSNYDINHYFEDVCNEILLHLVD